MKYQVTLRVQLQEEKWVAMGEDHIILWDIRDLVAASSGWVVLNQKNIGLADAFIPVLEKGLWELTQHTHVYDDYEISYGPGTISDTTIFYRNLLKDCKEHPFTELYGSVVA